MSRDLAYDAKLDALKEKYEPRIRAVLGRASDAFRALGMEAGEVAEASDEEYLFSFQVGPPGSERIEDCIDVRFMIAESRVRDGEGQGVNFVLDCDGEFPLASIAPFNHTPEVWVDIDDHEAIEARFLMVEDEDMKGLAAEAVGRLR